jgi:hypothetical protein
MKITHLRVLGLAVAAALTTMVLAPAPSDAGLKTQGPAELRVSTFNLLGASHTETGALKWMGTGVQRMGRAVQILDNQRIDIVGFQEMQPPQVAEFQRLRSTTWGLYPGAELRDIDGANSIAWRKSVWTLVEASTRSIPYFNGKIREMPFLLMRHNATGQLAYFFDVHNPVSNRSKGDNDVWRAMAINKEITAVNEMRATSTVPVFVVGDMNEREKVFCPYVRRAALHAANGGSATDTTCTMPPKPLLVDWVFGTSEVTFHGYLKVQTKFVQMTTDHPVVVSGATLPVPVPAP